MKKLIDLITSFSPASKDTTYVEQPNGTKCWYKNGLLHRLDAPAVEATNGTTMWYKNGIIHRDNGPAIEYADGTKMWYRNNNLHREDGPAIIWPDDINGTQHEYYINGNRQHSAADPAPSP